MSPVTDLVLEGGGIKGTALVGAAAALKDSGYTFNRIAGTSSGALVGGLLAAGVTPSRLHDLLLDTDYAQFLDKTVWEHVPLPLLNDVASEVADKGLYKGDALHDFIASTLRDGGILTFADLRLNDPGIDPNVAPERRYKLVVVAADVSRHRMVRIPWYMRGAYGLDPDAVSVADAVRMSTAIPLFYKPFMLRSALTGQDSYMVDGGLVSGFPVDIFDRTDGVPPRWPTIFVGLERSLAPSAAVQQPSGIFKYLDALLLTGLDGRDNAELDVPYAHRRSIFIDTSYVSPTDFSVDVATRERLYNDGYAAAKRFLAGFSFSSYVTAQTRAASR